MKCKPIIHYLSVFMNCHVLTAVLLYLCSFFFTIYIVSKVSKSTDSASKEQLLSPCDIADMKKHHFFFMSFFHPIRVEFITTDNAILNTNYVWHSPLRTVVPVTSVSSLRPLACSCYCAQRSAYPCRHVIELHNLNAPNRCAWHIRDVQDRKWLRQGHETLPQ